MPDAQRRFRPQLVCAPAPAVLVARCGESLWSWNSTSERDFQFQAWPADTPLAASVKDMIAAQLDDAQARFTVIGPGHHGDSTVSQSPGAQPGSS